MSERRSNLSLAVAHLGQDGNHHMIANEQEAYRLFFVDKDHPKQIQSVTILKTAFVEDLQHQIQQRRYKNVDPSELDLFQVDISDEGDLAQKIEEKSKDLGSPLLPSPRLIRYYPSTPPEDSIHILVWCSASPQKFGEGFLWSNRTVY
ncbi:hypothetical protein PIIN_10852 [Serendipita indica DSM 11827]|uniref:Crinkler effector protein N-terminal domain-containing protein n=1 Tax=Serendipita indica (strain DSM 11827) TaxID=1109443 RepID=G4TZX4_SERID|nr:hypothetical protein PIIN_10852 [Serendipita indica DSM 11827]